MKFSGHETFSCRATWLKKGLDFVLDDDEVVNPTRFLQPNAATKLGVGRNMVNSIRYWLSAFGVILEEEGIETNIKGVIFKENIKSYSTTNILSFLYQSKTADAPKALDLYLEDPLTLWLLHYKLVTTNYATIYNFFFLNFIPRKSNDSFTEQEFLLALKSYIRASGISVPSFKTLEIDFKVLLDMYAVKLKKSNDIDDTSLNVLQPLEILTRQRLTKEKIIFYSLNRASFKEVPKDLIGLIILEIFKLKDMKGRKSLSASADFLLEEVGRAFCFSQEAFRDTLFELGSDYPDIFSFSQSRSTGIDEFLVRKLLTSEQFLTLRYIK